MDPDVHHFTMNPRSIIYLHEYYRFISSTLFHGSLMHIGMNMMSTFAICGLLEARFGTLRHAMTILWAMLLTSATYTLVAFLLHAIFGYEQLMYQHALGFSGVIFHLSVLECNLSNGSRSIFGVFSVPSYLYPWVLLLVLQFIMPNLSFMGHLAGILTGTLQLYGALDAIMVGEQYAKEMEGWPILRPVTSRPNFISSPTTTLTETTLLPRDGLVQATCKGGQMVVKFVRDVVETLVYIVFGRGREANSNLHIFSRATTVVESGSDYFEDDDWVGLPAMPEALNSEQSRLL